MGTTLAHLWKEESKGKHRVKETLINDMNVGIAVIVLGNSNIFRYILDLYINYDVITKKINKVDNEDKNSLRLELQEFIRRDAKLNHFDIVLR